MSDHVEKTLEMLRRKLSDDEQAVRDTKKLINQLLVLMKQPPQFPDAEEAAATFTGASLNGDEYVGQRQSTACRMILERRKATQRGPATVEELYADLIGGGYRFDARDEAIARRGVYQMLSQNTAMFFRIPNGKWGLAAWYPEAKAAIRAAKQEATTKQRKKKPKPKAAGGGSKAGPEQGPPTPRQDAAKKGSGTAAA
jgi:hypothetical protein